MYDVHDCSRTNQTPCLSTLASQTSLSQRHVAHSSHGLFAAGPVIVIYCFQRCSGIERRVSAIILTPEVKASGLKAKAEDLSYCPRGASRQRTWHRGLQHSSEVVAIRQWLLTLVLWALLCGENSVDARKETSSCVSGLDQFSFAGDGNSNNCGVEWYCAS